MNQFFSANLILIRRFKLLAAEPRQLRQQLIGCLQALTIPWHFELHSLAVMMMGERALKGNKKKSIFLPQTNSSRVR